MNIFIVLLILSFNAISFKKIEPQIRIERFIDRIMQDQTFELFCNLKYYFSSPIAIETCFQMYESQECTTFILVYIPDNNSNKGAAPRRRDPDEEEQKPKTYLEILNEIFSKYNGPLQNFFNFQVLIDKLIKKFRITNDGFYRFDLMARRHK